MIAVIVGERSEASDGHLPADLRLVSAVGPFLGAKRTLP
jgi:hypothetical protein